MGGGDRRRPFFHIGDHVEFEETLLHGSLRLRPRVGIGRWGPVFLELNQCHGLTPELESRCFTGVAGGANLAPVAYVVEDLSAESGRLGAAGMPTFLPLDGPGADRAARGALLGHAIEVHEDTEAIRACSL